jgi:hypothetical protein
MLAEAGLPPSFRLERLCGGANNRVYRVACGESSALLKAYFRHPQDTRDRLGAEYAFSQFAWDRGLRCIPRPMACDRAGGLGLYEFIEGRSLAPGQVGEVEVRQAVDFYVGLNRHKRHPEARSLGSAAEACFSLADHLACVESRLARLAGLGSATALDREAGALVRGELGPLWAAVRDRVLSGAAGWGLPADRALDRQAQGCLSPSDFGFHNAILAADGRLRFFDFEYAGWDDPAKMVCDFFSQPAVPVPQTCFESFVEAVVSEPADAEATRRRISLVLPVHRVKWCCILLNDFLPLGGRRRRFASGEKDPDERKREQLEKARLAMKQVEILNADPRF